MYMDILYKYIVANTLPNFLEDWDGVSKLAGVTIRSQKTVELLVIPNKYIFMVFFFFAFEK